MGQRLAVLKAPLEFSYLPGATPIDPNDFYALIPSYISKQSELNELEQANILEAKMWISAQRSIVFIIAWSIFILFLMVMDDMLE